MLVVFSLIFIPVVSCFLRRCDCNPPACLLGLSDFFWCSVVRFKTEVLMEILFREKNL